MKFAILNQNSKLHKETGERHNTKSSLHKQIKNTARVKESFLVVRVGTSVIGAHWAGLEKDTKQRGLFWQNKGGSAFTSQVTSLIFFLVSGVSHPPGSIKDTAEFYNCTCNPPTRSVDTWWRVCVCVRVFTCVCVCVCLRVCVWAFVYVCAGLSVRGSIGVWFCEKVH